MCQLRAELPHTTTHEKFPVPLVHRLNLTRLVALIFVSSLNSELLRRLLGINSSKTKPNEKLIFSLRYAVTSSSSACQQPLTPFVSVRLARIADSVVTMAHRRVDVLKAHLASAASEVRN